MTLEAASAAGLVGARRVLDSMPLYDAVATMDTITLIRSAIRGLLRVADAALEAELRGVMGSGDDDAKHKLAVVGATAGRYYVEARDHPMRAMTVGVGVAMIGRGPEELVDMGTTDD